MKNVQIPFESQSCWTCQLVGERVGGGKEVACVQAFAQRLIFSLPKPARTASTQARGKVVDRTASESKNLLATSNFR